MYLIPVLALVVGLFIGYYTAVPITGNLGVYLAVGVVAGLDSVFGGWRSALEGKFQNDVFLTGFVANVLIASMMAWLGDHIGINLFLAAALVMGWRIFNNLSMIRRYALNRWHDDRNRRRAGKA